MIQAAAVAQRDKHLRVIEEGEIIVEVAAQAVADRRDDGGLGVEPAGRDVMTGMADGAVVEHEGEGTRDFHVVPVAHLEFGEGRWIAGGQRGTTDRCLGIELAAAEGDVVGVDGDRHAALALGRQREEQQTPPADGPAGVEAGAEPHLSCRLAGHQPQAAKGEGRWRVERGRGVHRESDLLPIGEVEAQGNGELVRHGDVDIQPRWRQREAVGSGDFADLVAIMPAEEVA